MTDQRENRPFPRAVGRIEAHVAILRAEYKYADSEARKDVVVASFLSDFDEVIRLLEQEQRL